MKPPIGTAIHRALTEPVLILGMERKLALYLLIPVGGVLAGGGLHWYTLGAWNLTADGCCNACLTPLPGVFEPQPGNWGARRQPVRLADVREG